ncbi:MAG: hypothetical protein NC328_04525 [Muribaculum sp.]|nr:hypothetical protein [Muribaculum sp.]
MKKFFTFALSALTLLGASAADQTIYQNGQLFAGAQAYNWWNSGFNFSEPNPDGTGVVFSFGTAEVATGGSMGIFNDASSWSNGTLNTATLSFDWYTASTGKYTIRLTDNSVTEENYVIQVSEQDLNKWNSVNLLLAEAFPTIARNWKAFKGDGKGYVFSVIQEDTQAGSKIYFNNIVYKNIDESWKAPAAETLPAPATVPVPTRDASDVLSLLSGSYPGAVAFNFANWGSPTKYETLTIDNAPVAYVKDFTYFGWEFVSHLDASGYDTMHVDYFTPNGTSFGFTPISPDHELGQVMPVVKQNEWNSYDIPLSTFTGVDFADLFQVKFDNGGGAEGYIANVYFYKENGGETPENPSEAKTFNGSVTSSVTQTMDEVAKDYPYTLDYAVTYNTDRTVTVDATYNWPDGEPVGLVAGSVFINNELNDFVMDGNKRTVTTAATYTEGETLNLNFYLPIALGVVETPVSYVVGSSSESTGVQAIEAVNAPAEYYNLQGVKVNRPQKGIYIMRQGNKAVKVIL